MTLCHDGAPFVTVKHSGSGFVTEARYKSLYTRKFDFRERKDTEDVN